MALCTTQLSFFAYGLRLQRCRIGAPSGRLLPHLFGHRVVAMRGDRCDAGRIVWSNIYAVRGSGRDVAKISCEQFVLLKVGCHRTILRFG
jgi:hypothetical protein